MKTLQFCFLLLFSSRQDFFLVLFSFESYLGWLAGRGLHIWIAKGKAKVQVPIPNRSQAININFSPVDMRVWDGLLEGRLGLWEDEGWTDGMEDGGWRMNGREGQTVVTGLLSIICA
jgi:hypothetical protein